MGSLGTNFTKIGDQIKNEPINKNEMIKSKVKVLLGLVFTLRILGSGLSDNWCAETSPSSGYIHMHRHPLSGYTWEKKSYGNLFPWRDSVLAIPSCIRCVNSECFKFDKWGNSKKNCEAFSQVQENPYGKTWRWTFDYSCLSSKLHLGLHLQATFTNP